MVRNNNIIPNGHFHKKWQVRVKMWFSQPMNKVRRQRARTQKQMKMAPQPVKLLRPIVHCPSVRYNSKLRFGRGFSIRDFKGAGFSPKFAKGIGIAVDRRRRNTSMESVFENVQRLKNYRARLVVFPKIAAKTEIMDFRRDTTLNTIKVEKKGRAMKVTDEQKKFQAHVTLRCERNNEKYRDLRLKRKMKGQLTDAV